MRPACLAGRRRQVAVVGDERARRRAPSACSTTGWRPPSMTKSSAGVDLGPHVVALDRKRRERRRDVERPRAPRAAALIGSRSRPSTCAGERARRCSSSSASARSAALAILASSSAELGGGEAHLAGQRLAMDEGRVERRAQQLVAVLRGHLDEIAEHVVVPDLQRADAGLLGIARLQGGDRRGAIRRAARAPRRAPRRSRRATKPPSRRNSGSSSASARGQLGGERSVGPRSAPERPLRSSRQLAASARAAPRARPRRRARRGCAARSRGPPRPTTRRDERAREIGRGR